jgi:hypothetical protein
MEPEGSSPHSQELGTKFSCVWTTSCFQQCNELPDFIEGGEFLEHQSNEQRQNRNLLYRVS